MVQRESARAATAMWKRKLQTFKNRTRKAFSLSFDAVPERKTLVEFARAQDVEAWQVRADSSVGGFSRADLVFVEQDQCARFHGELSLETSGEMIRSGFANIVTPATLMDLDEIDEYDGVELTVRWNDERTYFFNLQTENLVPHHLHQAFVAPPQARPRRSVGIVQAREAEGMEGFHRVRLLFERDFVLTWRGMVQEEQPLMNTSKLQTLGFTLADKQEGPFSLDLHSITLVKANVEEDGQM